MADIKRLNGLVTDLQMFALKTLKIPLPGKHPPSPTLCNGHDSQRYLALIPISVIVLKYMHFLCYEFDLLAYVIFSFVVHVLGII